MGNLDFRGLSELGLPTLPEKNIIRVANAKATLRRGFEWYFNCTGEVFKTHKAYNQVADWLADNEGKGLLLYGSCGQGKTILARYIIPRILVECCRIVPKYYNATEVNDHIDEAMKASFLILDDIGTEEVSVKYGQRRCAFDEIMNAAEQKGNVVIVTSNLTKDDILQVYGERTLDRINATMKRVLFKGASMRNK